MSGLDWSASHWFEADAQVKEGLASGKLDKSFAAVPADDAIARTKAAIEAKTWTCEVVADKAHALEAIKKFIPKGATVHNGASTTLREVGFVDYLKAGEHGWDNLHAKILAEQDPAKQTTLRRQASLAEYYLSSACAVSEQGDIVVVDLTGTRVAPFAYDAQKVVVVIGANKITKDYDTAVKRTNEWCLPLESARVRVAYGVPGSAINNFVAIRGPNPWGGQGRFHVIIVKESLGY
eukprot:TRINITY_DN1374_c0_g1_i2.p2 TRINITY_DN1374_c0_g1~~TRINITY_DN1374_c0_g1_i2.p2  ORF type:complete len:250 (+),score=79.75 TRINITY_DN1374_c0_g1_i2:45-752(+)